MYDLESKHTLVGADELSPPEDLAVRVRVEGRRVKSTTNRVATLTTWRVS